MSLDAVSLTPKAISYKAFWYDDAIGICTLSTLSGNYTIAQLDGSVQVRGSGTLPGEWLIPEIGTGNVYWVSGTTSTTLYPADLRLGTQVADPENYPPELVGRNFPLNPSYGRALGVLPDRILGYLTINFYATEGVKEYSQFTETWLVSWPRSLTAPQVFTYELLIEKNNISGDPNYFSPISPAGDDPNCIWIGPIRGGLPDDVSTTPYDYIKYNFVTKRRVSTTCLPVPTTTTYPDSRPCLAWSPALRRLVYVAREFQSIYANYAVPSTVSAPEVVSSDPRVLSIAPTNPAVITIDRSLSAWMDLHGMQSGDKVFLSPEILFSGQMNRFPSFPYRNESHITSRQLSGRTWPITVIDDRSFSVPVDAVNARAHLWATITQVNRDGEQNTSYNSKITLAYGDARGVHGWREGPQFEFHGFPTGHPVNGVKAPLHTLHAWYEFRDVTQVDPEFRDNQTPYFHLDKSAWGPYQLPNFSTLQGNISISADTTQMPIFDCSVSKAAHTAGIIDVDLTGPNPVLTVDNPTWLDDLGVTSPTAIRLWGYESGFPVAPGGLGWYFRYTEYQNTATRVAPNKFVYLNLSSDVVYTNETVLDLSTFVQGVQTEITLYYQRGLVVGDVLRWIHPTLGAILTNVIGVITPDKSFRLDLDSSGWATVDWSAILVAKAQEQRVRATATVVEYENKYNSDAKIVRTRVLGSRKEPCAGCAVLWSATDTLAAPVGSFKESVTETDEEGYAYAIYYPPAGAPGDYTITATVNTLTP